MKAEIIAEMEAFCIRVLKGGENVNMQETATLPKILEILKDLDKKPAFTPFDIKIGKGELGQAAREIYQSAGHNNEGKE